MGSTLRTDIERKVVSIPNDVYSRSPTSNTAQLAGLVKVRYTEVNTGTDLGRLQQKGEAGNYMDTVHTLRDNYAADIVALYGYYPAEAGRGYVNADPTTAFYVVNYRAAEDQYSTSHETGHIFGANHDTVNTPENTPYAYGHGIFATYNGNDWGTIMSYRGVGDRQRFYSNPDSMFRGNVRGTVARCNVTRVHRERDATVAAFRTPQATVTLQNRTLKTYEYGDVMASSSITVNGPDTVKGNSELRLRATNMVNINSGFVLEANGKLTITTGSTALAKKGIFHNQPPQNPTVSSIMPLKPGLQAGLENGIIKMRYALPEDALVSVRLFDLNGRLAFEKYLGEKQAGYYNEIIDKKAVGGAKIYLIEMTSGKTIMTAKVIGVR
jgi:hypothetical protein